MNFDIIGAKKAGYSDDEIAIYMAGDTGNLGETLKYVQDFQKQPTATARSMIGGQPQVKKDDGKSFAGNVATGWKQGVENMQALTYGGVGLAADVAGRIAPAAKEYTDPVKEWGYKGFVRNEKEAAQYKPDVQSFHDVDWGDLESVTDWVGYVGGSLAPSVIEAGVGAAIGGIVGGAASGGVGLAPGAVGGAVSRGVVKSYLRKLVAKKLKTAAFKKLAKKSGIKFAEKQALKAVGKSIGAGLGVVEATALIEGGGMWGEAAKKKGIENASPFSAAALSQVSGLTELVSPGGIVAKKLGTLGSDGIQLFAREVTNGVGRKLLTRLGVAVPKSMVQEGAQEGVQEFLSKIHEKIVDPDVSLTDKQALSQYLDSAAAGAVGGLGFGAVNAVTTKASPDAEYYQTKIRNISKIPEERRSPRMQRNYEAAVAELEKLSPQDAAPEKKETKAATEAINASNAELRQQYAKDIFEQIKAGTITNDEVLNLVGDDEQLLGEIDALQQQPEEPITAVTTPGTPEVIPQAPAPSAVDMVDQQITEAQAGNVESSVMGQAFQNALDVKQQDEVKGRRQAAKEAPTLPSEAERQAQAYLSIKNKRQAIADGTATLNDDERAWLKQEQETQQAKENDLKLMDDFLKRQKRFKKEEELYKKAETNLPEKSKYMKELRAEQGRVIDEAANNAQVVAEQGAAKKLQFDEKQAEVAKQEQAELKKKEAVLPAADKAGLRKEAKALVDDNPIYQHMEAARGQALDLGQLYKDFDADTVKGIQKKYPAIFSLNGTTSPDGFAKDKGYSDLNDMIVQWDAVSSKKDAIEEIYQQKIKEWQVADEQAQEALNEEKPQVDKSRKDNQETQAESKGEKAKPDASKQEFEHNGLKIYKTQIGEEEYWAVQLPKNKGTSKIMGDELFPNIKDAKNGADFIIKQENEKVQRKKDFEARAKKEDEEQAKKNDTQGFTDNLSPVAAGRVTKILNKFVGLNGKYGARKQLIADLVDDGYKVVQEATLKSVKKENGERKLVDVKTGKRIFQAEDGGHFSEKVLTKTGMDYASFLESKKAKPDTSFDFGENVGKTKEELAGNSSLGVVGDQTPFYSKTNITKPKLTRDVVVGSLAANTIREEFGEFINDDVDSDLAFLAQGGIEEDSYYINEELEKQGNYKTTLEFVEEAAEDIDGQIEQGSTLEDEYEPYTPQQAPKPEEYEARARSNYGITSNPKTAGYILANGDMLNFGDGGFDSRGFDHRAIVSEVREPTNPNSSRYGAIEEFGAVTGAIRLHYQDNGYVSFDILKKPTKAQIDVMLGLVAEGTEVTIDYVDSKGVTQSIEAKGKLKSKQAIQQAARKANTTPVNYSKQPKAPTKPSTVTQVKSWLTLKLKKADKLFSSGKLNVVQTAKEMFKELGVSGDGVKYMTVYHGTPHSFDKFSTSNIGSGEGAQAYGHGLYFTDSKGIAKYYRDTLTSGGKSIYTYDDLKQLYDDNDYIYRTESDLWNDRNGIKPSDADFNKLNNVWVDQTGGNPVNFIKGTNGKWATADKKGHLYKVELAPKENEYLLWDKPLSEQSEFVKKSLGNISDEENYRSYDNFEHLAIAAIKGEHPRDSNYIPTGDEIYSDLTDILKTDKAASDYLHSLGIRGIKYVDGMTRNKKGAKSYNYVIFSDDDVEILVKYSKNGDIQGAYDPKTGKAYIVADGVTKNTAFPVALHELAHAAKDQGGWKAIFGKQHAAIMRQARLMLKAGNKAMKAAEQKAKDAGTPQVDMAEETITYFLADKAAQKTTLWQKIKKAIKRWAFNLGLTGKIDEDIIASLAESMVQKYDGKQGQQKKSSGVKMSLKEAGFKAVDVASKSFKKWFGDSVVTENGKAGGKPLVVYHGTNADIHKFTAESLGANTGVPSAKLGFFFTNQPYTAGQYTSGKKILPQTRKEREALVGGWYKKTDNFISKRAKETGAKNRYEFFKTKEGKNLSKELDDISNLRYMGTGFGVGAKIMPLHLSIKNPYIVDMDSAIYRERKYVDIIKDAINKKHDGVIIKNTYDPGGFGIKDAEDIYVAFSPTQIKSAISNTGAFSKNDPRIKFSITKQQAKADKEALKAKVDAIIKKIKLTSGVISEPKTKNLIKSYEKMIATMKDSKASMVAKHKELAKFIRNNAPPVVRGKVFHFFPKIAKAVRPATQQKYLNQAYKRTVKLMDKYIADEYRKRFLKQIVVKKRPKSGPKKGTRSVEVEKYIDYLKKEKPYKMTKEQAEIELAKMQAEEEKLRANDPKTKGDIAKNKRNIADLEYKQYLLSLFSGYKEWNAREAREAYETLSGMIKQGRSIWQEQKQYWKDKHAANRLMENQDITGKENPVNETQTARNDRERKEQNSRVKRMLQKLSYFEDIQQSWPWLLDKIAKGYKGKALTAPSTEYFSRLVFTAFDSNNTATREDLETINNKASELTGLKGKNLNNWLRDMGRSDGKFKKRLISIPIVDKEGKQVETLELTPMQATYYYTLSRQEELLPTFEGMGITTEALDNMAKQIDPRLKKIAKWLSDDLFEQKYERANEIHKIVYGRELSKVDYYFPVKRDRGPDAKPDVSMEQTAFEKSGMNKGFAYERTKNTIPFKEMNFLEVAVDHIVDMNHFINMALPMKELRGVFSNPETRKFIEQYHGKSMNSVVEDFLTAFAEGDKYRAKLIPWLDRMRANFVTSVIGLKPAIFAKQVVSFPAFMAAIPKEDFAKGFAYAVKHPLKVSKILNDIDWVKNRYGTGWTRDIKIAATRKAHGMVSGQTNLASDLMFMTKAGDKFAIFAGGYAVYKYHYDKQIKAGATPAAAKKEAEYQFASTAALSQQDAQKFSLSRVQRGSQMYRFMSMFMNALSQYTRHIVGAIRHMGDSKEAAVDSAKRLIIYWGILSAMFSAVAAAPLLAGDDDDKKEYMKRVAMGMVLGPLNGIFLVRDVVNFLANRLIFKKWYSAQFSPVSDVVEETGRLLSELQKDEIDLHDVVKASTQLFGYSTGLPVEAVRNSAEGISEGDTMQALGWTPSVLPDKK